MSRPHLGMERSGTEMTVLAASSDVPLWGPFELSLSEPAEVRPFPDVTFGEICRHGDRIEATGVVRGQVLPLPKPSQALLLRRSSA